jgi:hypothetical protein
MFSQIKLKLKIEAKGQEPVEIELSQEDAKGLYEALKALVGEKEPCYVRYVPYIAPTYVPWSPSPYWTTNTCGTQKLTLEYCYE